ncbi:APC family permease [Sulfobacillus thermosulfidooxidans]|uniref:APC family permease n=1 Tax=Sulfobacillus thermosulfidooxidans TaxID=28034 RepID=UPI0006B55927|nr:APC family permease [Sulfobacillus thermosulfidooxidans]
MVKESPVTTMSLDPDVAPYRRELTFWDLVFVSITGVVGSGWLFGSYNAAKIAGPASLIAWVIGGIVVLLGALINGELVGMFPRAGGAMRYPLYSHGSLVAFLIGWGSWIPGAAGAATEAAAVIQYASSYLPGLFNGTTMTPEGVLVAAALVVLFTYINWLGIRVFAKINGPITVIKLAVPVATIIILFATSFHASNLTSHGFMPYHAKSIFLALATSGIVYAYLGSSGPLELAAEAKNPSQQIPRVLLMVVGFSFLLYTLLQLVFLAAVPPSLLNHVSWSGLSFNAPFANLLIAVNLVWFSYFLYADAILSPSGTALSGTAVVSRIVYALGLEGWAPKFLAYVSEKTGVPTRALLINLLFSVLFLLPFPSWQALVGVIVTCALFIRLVIPISHMVMRKTLPDQPRPFRTPWAMVVSPLATMISALIIYWVGWPINGQVILFFAIGIVFYAVSFKKQKWPTSHITHGIWFLVFMGFLAGMSWLGTYGGRHVIPAPWDSLAVAVGSLLLWGWGYASGLPIDQALMGGRQTSVEVRVQEPELSSFDQNF